jgi:rhodanese-related sulfurtransferase
MKISKEQVLESMRKNQSVVLNVLSKSDYRKLHIKGSENHPLMEDVDLFSREVEGRFGKKRPFIVYGDHFGLLESYFAVKALEDRGMKAFNYAGGLREWQGAGLPVEGTEVGDGAGVKT